MKEYQIRTADLKAIRLRFDGWEVERNVRNAYVSFLRDYPAWKDDAVLVLAEWETPEEADKARLDWLEADKSGVSFDVEGNSWSLLYDDRLARTLRELIDDARNAPAPKVTVIKDSK